MATKKTFRQKLNPDRQHHIEPVPPSMQKNCGTGMMLIPQPWQVDALIRAIPEGQIATLNEIRQELAQRLGADVTCPLVAGISWGISAKAAEEQPEIGAPWWRVVKTDGALNPKLPGGTERHKAMLLAEGAKFNARGNRVDLEAAQHADFSRVKLEPSAA